MVRRMKRRLTGCGTIFTGSTSCTNFNHHFDNHFQKPELETLSKLRGGIELFESATACKIKREERLEKVLIESW
jgi:hypothetical protein